MSFISIQRTPRPTRVDHGTRPDRTGADGGRFGRGVRTLVDLIAPAAMEVGRNHVRLEHQYVRVLAITSYPRTVTAGWLQTLINFDAPIEISLHLHPLATGPMIRHLDHQLVQLHSSRLLDDRSGRLPNAERDVASADIESLRDALQQGTERVVSVGLYVQLRATSLALLDEVTRRLHSTLDGMRVDARPALLEQDLGFRTCLPECHDAIMVNRNLDTSSVATLFPFCSGSLSMPHGVLYGIDRSTSSPVFIDPFDQRLDNSNMVVFAASGAGKSYFLKLLLLRLMAGGVDALIIDPEDEYRAVCTAAEGQTVRMSSASHQHINPFDLPPTIDGDEPDPLAEQVSAVLSLLDVMLSEPTHPLTTQERSILDAAIYATYARAGVTADIETHERPAPLLADLQETLHATPGDVPASLAARLRRYSEGSLSGLFSGPTNVELRSRCVVFNVQALEEELRAIAIHLITSLIWKQVRRERRPRMLVIDEAWSLVQYPEGGAFLSRMARRARKYHLGVITSTQDVSDFLNNEHGRVVLTNAAVTCLLKQSSATITPVLEAFALSPEERQYLLGAGKGEGLFFCQGRHLALQIAASPVEHRLATTAPRDVAEPARQTMTASVGTLPGGRGGVQHGRDGRPRRRLLTRAEDQEEDHDG